MARCMKFPPTGYVWNGVSGDAVLGLIKVMRREARGAAEKRRKKEKRRREKEEEEALEEGEIRERKCSDKHKKIQKVDYDHQMNGEYEISSLTEELEKPLFDSLSTLNQYSCSIIRTDSVVQEKYELAFLVISRPSSLQRTAAIDDGKDETVNSTFMLSETCLQHVESVYRERIVNLVPPPIQIEQPEFDDQEWLINRKLPRSNMTETTIFNSLNDGRSSLYPSAQYLPQADILALPYTTLF